MTDTLNSQFSPQCHSKVTYYSRSKVTIHLSNKSTLQLKSEGLSKGYNVA